MRHIIINIKTKEPIKQKDEILYFRNKTTAEKYYSLSLNQSSDYIIKAFADKEAKGKINLLENKIKDIYHSIENSNSNEELLILAQELQVVLKERRKIKNKIRGVRGNIQYATPYKKRSD